MRNIPARLLFLIFPALVSAQDLHLHPCIGVQALCGYLTQPLDPLGQVPGTIDIHFEIYAPRDQSQPPVGTIVAVEGGPGFATTSSAAGYYTLFYPLLENRQMVLVNNRGTGLSGTIDCNPLQTEPVQTVHDVGACGTALGAASDLYGTALATDDMAAILEALGTGPVDLYGDSYGTWFSQAFAVNHPDLVRSVILDSAYPVLGENPFYPLSGIYSRIDYDLVCQRSLNCAPLPGTAQERIDALVGLVRTTPIQGSGDDGNGTLRTVTVNPAELAQAIYAGTTGPVIYRELDPAARAYMDNGDAVPLLRLIATANNTSGYMQSGGSASQYSRGLFAAVSCSDYPQIYNMTSSLADRLQQEQALLSLEQQKDPGVYAPFTIGEFRQTSLDVGVLDLCLGWPAPSAQYPPQHSVPPDAVFPNVPVLVLSGELDSLTTPQEGKMAAALFPNAKQVLIANSFHVTAVGDFDHCASRIATTFFATLTPGDTSCASRIPEVRMVPNFAVTIDQVQGAEPQDGNAGTPFDLQIAAGAALAAGDVLARYFVNATGSGAGLRGGTFAYGTKGDDIHFELAKIQWTTDVTATGTIDWNAITGAIFADLNVAGPDGESGEITAAWNSITPNAFATLGGQIGGRPIAAAMYAPF